MDDNNSSRTRQPFGQKEIFDYYWRYYELQSNQRNQLCSFYFTIMAALVAVLTAISSDNENSVWIICFAMGIIALFFGLMYYRTTTLRNHARQCLIDFEQELLEANNTMTQYKMDKIFEFENNDKGTSHTRIMYWQFILCTIFFFAVGISKYKM